MAEEAQKAPQPQTNQGQVDIAFAPEPDLDKLLSATPGFEKLFGEESGKDKEPKKEPAPKDAVVEAPPEETEESQQIELPEALPLEEEPAPTEEEKEEQPHDAVQKRIDELTAKRKGAEEKAAKLETEINDLKAKLAAPPRIAPSERSPLANVNTLEEVKNRLELAQLAENWATRNLDGGEIPVGNGQTQFVEASTAREILARAREMISKHVPIRTDYLIKKAAYDNEAKVFYPALFKAGSVDQLSYNEWIKALPQLAEYPDLALIVGDALAGARIREAKKKGRGNGNVQIPPLSKATPAASQKVPSKRALSSAELGQIASNPDGNMLDRFVSQLIDDAATQRSKR